MALNGVRDTASAITSIHAQVAAFANALSTPEPNSDEVE
jgi:hypothetical protein